MKLIVGLGNPGAEYQNSRHNLGFIAIDYLADRPDGRRTLSRPEAAVVETTDLYEQKRSGRTGRRGFL